MEQELKRMFKNKGSEMSVPSTMPQELRSRVGRHRMITGGLAVTAVIALLLGGFAGARSLSNEEALPPAKEDSNADPFVDTWTTTDVQGRTRTMVIRASGEDTYEVTVENHLSLACSGAPQTLTGTGRLFGSTMLALRSPEITCDDGSEPNVEDDPAFLEEVFYELTFEHDPEPDILTNYSPLESRRVEKDGQAIYNGLTLVWARADAENRIGDVSGWVTYGNGQGIWARDLTSPRDPSDRVRLSFASGTPLAWSPDGSKLLVLREVPGPDPDTTFSSDLFVVSSDGTETRLTKEYGVDGASLSPDGTEVVYAKGSALYAVDTEGGSPRLLHSAGKRWFEDSRCPQFKGCVGGERPVVTSLQEPKFSPDGAQIAYFDGNGDSGHSLRVIDSDGTDMQVVVENSETLGVGHVYGLEWSPDGSRLAFSIEDRIYVVGEDGSGFRLVSDNGVHPYWSPDGSHIAYTRPDPQASERGSLEIVRLQDLQVQNLGAGESGLWTSEVHWSADGQ